MFKIVVLLYYTTYGLDLPIWCKVPMWICLLIEWIETGIKIYKAGKENRD